MNFAVGTSVVASDASERETFIAPGSPSRCDTSIYRADRDLLDIK